MYKFKVGDIVEYYDGGSGSMSLGSIIEITPVKFKIYWLKLGFATDLDRDSAYRALRLVETKK